MPTNKRPDEAILPQPARPQLANDGQRSRPSHLARITRYPDGSVPTGFPQRSGSRAISKLPPTSTCSYRNAAFQALLNAPMFVEFLRSHNRQIRQRGKACAIRKCLTCATVNLASEYWSGDRSQEYIERSLYDLWTTCWETFWGKEKPDKTRIGPSQVEEEFYTDTFLLHFLAAMQQQLETLPSEYATFQSMFTVHMARRWKCKSSVCRWTGPPHKWESSFFLPILVQRPHPKKPQTSLMEGLSAGLKAWEQKKLASRRGSISQLSMCGKCGSDVESQIDLVNLPELLILVRNIELLDLETDSPDIPYKDQIELKAFTPSRQLAGDATLRTYQLVSGTMEQRSPRKHSHAVAFARGPTDSELWFGVDDTVIEQAQCLENIDAQQRPSHTVKTRSALSSSPLLLPEILIYRRIDDNGWNYEYQADHAPVQSAGIPDLYQEDRLGVSRSIHERFIYQVGQGHLKFKVDLFPGDPEPQEVIDFNIDLGYEFNGNHWAVKLESKLLPLTGAEADYNIAPPPTAFRLRPVYRNRRRREGALSPEATQEEREDFADQFSFPGNPDTAGTSQDNQMPHSREHVFDNPFTNTSGVAINSNTMDLDPPVPNSAFPFNRERDEQNRKRDVEVAMQFLDKVLDSRGRSNGSKSNKGKERARSSSRGGNQTGGKRRNSEHHERTKRNKVRISEFQSGGLRNNSNNNNNHNKGKNSQHHNRQSKDKDRKVRFNKKHT